MAITRTPLIDDDGSGATGTILNNAWQNGLYNQIDAFVMNGGAWATYTPLWSGSDGTLPTLGNGLLSGRYVRIGTWIDVAIVLQLGSTSTIGTSTYWTVTLPFEARKVSTLYQETTFRCGGVHSSGAGVGALLGYAVTALHVYALNPSNALWGPTIPFAWDAGSLFTIRGSYETL